MQTREKLRQKGHDRNRKTTGCERGKYNFLMGGKGEKPFLDQNIDPCVNAFNPILLV
jgi:hypothetical protein